MHVRLTSIQNAKDVRPSSFTLEWNDLMALFAEQANTIRPISDKEMFRLPALYPTVYADNSFRKIKENVIGYGAWTAVDIDHVMTLDELRQFYNTHILDGCIFTTTSRCRRAPIRTRPGSSAPRNAELRKAR